MAIFWKIFQNKVEEKYWLIKTLSNGHRIVNIKNGSMLCCCFSVTQSCPTLCNPMDCSTPGLLVPHHLPKFAQGHVHCISDAIQPSHLLMPSSPSAPNLPQHQNFSNEPSVHIRWPKYWMELQLQHQSFHWVFRVDWCDLLAVQGALRSILQRHSSKASIPWHSAFLRFSSYNHMWPLLYFMFTKKYF